MDGRVFDKTDETLKKEHEKQNVTFIYVVTEKRKCMGYKHIKFQDNSTFLITGAAGFIGSNLCEAVLNLGYRVRALDDLSTGHYENIEPFLENPKFTFIKGDIKDLDTCLRAADGVDYVLNQAAWGSVPRSIEMPLFYCR